ncbi:MAG: hypothetical protein NTX85_00390 [Candidatus Nomurabacteria bacterium]|nr:hypothetical protein [Candidatus Nomurabacteria bacterium]
MEKYNLEFKKFFSKREVKVFNPHVHWMMLVRLFSVLFILAVIASVYFFNQIKDEKIFREKNVSTPENNLITRNQKLLDKVSDYFSEKETKMNSLKKEGINLEDPRIQK